jgi:parallel beta-helix repeat protein
MRMDSERSGGCSHRRNAGTSVLPRAGAADITTGSMRVTSFLAAGVLNLLLVSYSLGQGSLTPPKPPGPTMKSLDQIDAHVGQLDTHVTQAGEKRIPIDSTHTPGDAKDEAVIKAAGSYYLTGNLNVAKTNGIAVNADGVTLDLNGFEIKRESGGATTGIGVLITGNRCVVKNGSVANFNGGVQTVGNVGHGAYSHLSANGCAVGLVSGFAWRLEQCDASGCTSTGIRVGSNSAATRCTASDNFEGISLAGAVTISDSNASNNATKGFSASYSCSLINCSAQANTIYGISVGAECTLLNCSTTGNGAGNTDVSGGILTGAGCSLQNCSSNSNRTGASPAAYNNGFGLDIGNGSVMSNCTASNNSAAGIVFRNDCLLTGNTASHNAGAGFDDADTAGQFNRIDGNHASENGGIGFAWFNDILIRNSAFGNIGGNYNPMAGANNSGPPGSANSTTNPWANF